MISLWSLKVPFNIQQKETNNFSKNKKAQHDSERIIFIALFFQKPTSLVFWRVKVSVSRLKNLIMLIT